MKAILTPIIFLAALASALAGEHNAVLSVGDAAPAWKDLEGVDGKKHSLADLKDKDVIVVAFTCNSCPVAVGYEERILAFVGKHCGKQSRVAFVAINVNTGKDDLPPKMKERAEKQKFTFPYLYDGTQEIAKAYGAKYTPEFFVLNKDRKIAYLGAMDDKTKAADAKENYLVPAVEATLAGKAAAKPETAARGCKIKYLQAKDK